MVPSPASATSTTRSGSSAAHKSALSPSKAIGERTPPTVSTHRTSGSGGGQRNSATKSATENTGRTSTAAAIGGASAAAYHRCSGHTSFGCSPVAAASTSASVGPASALSYDCTGFRAATVVPEVRSVDSTAAPTHVLPISV